MVKKPTYEELEQRVKELEKGAIERKQPEESLGEEKEFATSLIDNAPIFFVAIDAQGKTMRMNQRLLKVLGYTTNEVVGKDYLSNFVPERDRDMLASVFRKLTAEQEHTFNENHILSKDGKEFLVEWHGTPVFDTSSKLQYFYGLGINITSRKQAEEALRESEERHRLLLEVSPDPIVVYGIEGKTIYVNPAFEQTFGWSLDELREKRIDFVPEENWPETKETINRMLQGLKIKLFETRRLTKDGRILDIQLSSSLFFDQDKKPAGNIVILRDITVQKRAERTLRKAHDQLEQRVKERTAELVLINENLRQEIVDRQHAEAELKRKITELNSFINNVPAMAWLKDTESRFIAVNSEFGEAVGMNPESLINHTCEVCFGKEEAKKFRKDDLKVMKSTRQVIIEEKITDSQKNEIWLETIKSPIFGESGKVLGTVGIARDITTRKEAEKALRESEKKYRLLSEGTFEAVVWHDKGKIVEANKQYYDLFGYKPDQLAEKDAILLTASSDSIKFMKEQISSGNQGPYEVVGMKKDGTEFPMEIRVKMMKYKGKMARMAAIRDLTERKQAEEALQESEKRYRAVVESQIEMICRFLSDGTITFVNNAYCNFFDKNQEELIGQKFMPLISEEDQEKVFKNIASLNPSAPIITHEHRVLNANGKIFWHKWTNRAIFNDQGKLLEYQGVGWDITERVHAEEALRKAHDELERRVKERTKELEIKKKGLEEINTAMTVLLKKREEDKTELEDNVLTNVKELVEPYFEKIKKTKLDDHQEAFLSIIESNMKEIISPFTRKMSLKYLNLTPTEIRIANLIRHGSSSKKIAEIQNVSPRTIDTHRKNIRRKIGIQGQRGNLRSHLLSLH